MMSPYEIKKEICEIGRRIYMNGFVAANDGNISVKVSENEYYCTPTGVSKGCLLYTSTSAPRGKPSAGPNNPRLLTQFCGLCPVSWPKPLCSTRGNSIRR